MAFDNDEAMQKKWKAFVRKIDTKIDDFSTVLKTIKTFLSEPFIAAMEYKELDGLIPKERIFFPQLRKLKPCLY